MTPIEALRELIYCKDLKDELQVIEADEWQAENSGQQSGVNLRDMQAKRDDYQRRKPLAWANARAALAAHDAQPATEPSEPMTREFCVDYPGTAAGIINRLARQIDAQQQKQCICEMYYHRGQLTAGWVCPVHGQQF
jgi:hypothetical protein